MKRSVILTLCIILCLALTLGGTIAYLSDFDGDVNVMTLGQVKIEVVESQRSEDYTRMVEYQDHKPLYPIVGDVTQSDAKYGMPINPLFVDKVVQVQSHSSNADAYMRVFIGVPSAVLNVDGHGTQAVHLLWGKDTNVIKNWPWAEDVNMRKEVTIDKIPYTMFCYDYAKLLEPGEVTEPLLAGLYLDQRVDNSDNPDDGYTMWIGGTEYPIDCDLTHGLQVMVLAQAVQASGFANAAQAFEESGMNAVDFDKELDLEIRIVLLPEIQKLVDELLASLGGDNGPEVMLTEASYTIDADAAAALNDIAMQVGKNKEIALQIDHGMTTHIELTGEPLAENVAIVNNGGTLTLIGPDADE